MNEMSSIRAALLGRDGSRLATCYHCGHEQEAPVRAQTISCRACFKQISIPDIHVRALHWGGSLRTSGEIIIDRKARVVCQSVIAAKNVRVLGHLEADVRAGGAVYVGPEAVLKGAVRAQKLIIEPGAQLTGGPFIVPGSFIESSQPARA
ncbi:MAG: polymer-forming cytoskeletal protein [Planctomycetota bacterium]|nr:MAG: polymer-forming cytoskeletal protein [Planctomycetota bacterium]